MIIEGYCQSTETYCPHELHVIALLDEHTIKLVLDGKTIFLEPDAVLALVTYLRLFLKDPELLD